MYVVTLSHDRAPDYSLYIYISHIIIMRAESIYIICDTHTVELYPNSVVHRGNRRTPRAVHEQDRQRTYTSNIETRLRNNFCRGKANIVTHLECVCVCVCVCVRACVCVSAALVIQHAKRVRHIILSLVACLAVPYFSTLCGTTFGRKLLNVKCVFDYFYSFCS